MRSLKLTPVLIFAAGMPVNASAPTPPVAPVRPVTENYFGVEVADPYRWMEDRRSPEFLQYMTAQGAYARVILDRLPGHDRLQARIAAHTGGGVAVTEVQTAGERIFFLRRAPNENTFKLWVHEKSGHDRLLIDPDRYAEPGQHFAIGYYVPAPQGDKLLYGISPGGSEQSVIHILDVASAQEVTRDLLVDSDAGHGMGSTKLQRDREVADELAFLYWQIGWSTYQPPAN